MINPNHFFRGNERDLGKEMLKAYLAGLIICQHGHKREAVKFWEDIYLSEASSGELTDELLAYDRSKGRLEASRNGNPLNLVALLIYNISNTGNLDQERRESFLARIQKGERITEVNTMQKGLDLVESLYHTHLNRDQISRFINHQVNLDRVTGMVEEEYERL